MHERTIDGILRGACGWISARRHKAPLPRVVSFLVTNRCVCRCKHCFNWAETGSGGAIGNTAKRDLSVAEIDRIFGNLGKLDYVYLAGGEPFTRSDMADILCSIHRRSRPKVISRGPVQGQCLLPT